MAEAEMSRETREMLRRIQRIIPPMMGKFHKGQMGRVGVMGGSQDYTGAPYFSAMASARLGCDLSHVICTPEAGAVIKTYSPNLMVHPLMRQSGHTSASAEEVSCEVIALLPRLHVLVVGPGLGRDPLMQDTAGRVILAARERGMPVVLDADALLLVQARPDMVRGYDQAVLTPNVVELRRLREALQGGRDGDGGAQGLAKALDGVTVVAKGEADVISNGSGSARVDLQGGRKRSGGQGDTLTGAVATFLAWRRAYHEELWEDDERMGGEETLRLAVFGGCAITRECSRRAFAKKGRSLQASDLTDEVHDAFLSLFGDVDGHSTAKLS